MGPHASTFRRQSSNVPYLASPDGNNQHAIGGYSMCFMVSSCSWTPMHSSEHEKCVDLIDQHHPVMGRSHHVWQMVSQGPALEPVGASWNGRYGASKFNSRASKRFRKSSFASSSHGFLERQNDEPHRRLVGLSLRNNPDHAQDDTGDELEYVENPYHLSMRKSSQFGFAQVSHTMEILRQSRVLLCVRLDDADSAYNAAAAALHAGLSCVEITFTTPDAMRIVRKLAKQYPNAHLGAGTVLHAEHAQQAVESGVHFMMSPILLPPDVIRSSHEQGVLCIPGAMTPTEVFTAHATYGAPLVKLFPTTLSMIQSLQGPFPEIGVIPTSGIPQDQIVEYLRQPNVWCIGASKQIVTKQAVREQDWSQIGRNARTWMEIASSNGHVHPENRRQTFSQRQGSR